MTDRQVRDEVFTLLAAGHETTANALTWTWLLLAEHPAVEAQLHGLEYTRRVLAESMRLYPPAWAVGRQALEDCVIGGHTIPAGAMVFGCQWITHRDERFFDRPLAFDPDRWAPEREAALPRYAYFPFGGGTRKCIGDAFAWTEGVLVLAALARRWRLRRADDAPVPVRAVITLRPATPVWMRLERAEVGNPGVRYTGNPEYRKSGSTA
jgi:cytochrome P450